MKESFEIAFIVDGVALAFIFIIVGEPKNKNQFYILKMILKLETEGISL